MKLNPLVAALAIAFSTAALAQNSGPVKIGFITDMSSVYADIDGPAGGEMIKWAAQDFGGKVLNRPIEVLTADHQNKADVASSKAREWIDKDGLSMLIGGTNSATSLAMAKAGGDFTNAMKAAKEFGITKTMKVAGLLVFINDVHSLGLANTEGLQLAGSWYWNQDAASRKFAQRFFDKYKRMPSSLQAADYSVAMNYLTAVKTAGTTDADKVMSTLKSMKINDFYNKGQIRADGRMIHDMYLFQVKSPKDSTAPWDYYKTCLLYTGDQAFTTVAESKCSLLKK